MGRMMVFKASQGKKFTNSSEHGVVLVVPSYTGSCEQEDHGSKSAWGKKLVRSHLNGKNMGWWHVPVIPEMAGSVT
jgi:hypothetical protein